MIGKNFVCQRKYHSGRGDKTHPVMVTVHSFIFFCNCTPEITNSFKQTCGLFPV